MNEKTVSQGEPTRAMPPTVPPVRNSGKAGRATPGTAKVVPPAAPNSPAGAAGGPPANADKTIERPAPGTAVRTPVAAAAAAVAAPAQAPAPGNAPAAIPPSGAQPAGGSSRPAPNPETEPEPRPKAPGPRRVRLAVSRVDPWSVMKLSFLLSIAVGIGIVVATAAVWVVLNQMQVFSDIRDIIEQAEAMNQFGTILEYFEFSRVLSVATVIAVVDIVLMTALATLGAFLYNLVAAMVGGLHLTLTDD
ncbi:MAG: DUF3566 domain-containing protein [Beutenbergiaceae bacterium]